ncbi:MAG: methionine--tRNA ligase subunit beta, partial [Enterococcus sp.]
SKSKGNVVYPEMLVERFGLDALRYYLLRAVPFGSDGVFTPEDFVSRVNYDLANDLGNLLNRTIAMINKYCDGIVPDYASKVTAFDSELSTTAANVVGNYHQAMEKMEFNTALSEVWQLISRANKYIDETQPWVLAKDETNRQELDSVMVHLAESLRIVAILLQPIMTQTPKEIFEQLGLTDQLSLQDLRFGEFPSETKVIAKGRPIFPRLEVDAEVEYIQKEMSAGLQGAEETVKWNPEETEMVSVKDQEIKYDDFDKVELKVAEVIDCQKVKGADKLLQFRLDAGDNQDRQILSGIAEFYADPKALIGKKVVIVANLKPRKMRGQISQGMILSAEDEKGNLAVVKAPKGMPNGAIIA